MMQNMLKYTSILKQKKWNRKKPLPKLPTTALPNNAIRCRNRIQEKSLVFIGGVTHGNSKQKAVFP